MYYSISEGSLFCTMRRNPVIDAYGVSLDVEKLKLKTTRILQNTLKNSGAFTPHLNKVG